MSWLIDPASKVLTGALAGLSERQALVAANLANIDTPGYRPSSIDFESALRSELSASGLPIDGDPMAAMTAAAGAPMGQAAPSIGPSAALGLRRTDPRHFAGGGTTGAPGMPSPAGFDGSLRNDGNTVDLESEMTALAENQLKFAAVSRLMTGKLGMLRDVAMGGR